MRTLEPLTIEHLCKRLKYLELYKKSEYNKSNAVDERIKETKEQIVEMAMKQYS